MTEFSVEEECRIIMAVVEFEITAMPLQLFLVCYYRLLRI